MAWLKWCLPGSSNAKLQLSPFHSLFIGNESFSPVFTQEEENLVAHLEWGVSENLWVYVTNARVIIGIRHRDFFFFFYKLMVCATLQRATLWMPFSPTAFALFVSLSHFINSHNMSDVFIVYLLWRSAIRDLWRYCCNCFGAPQTAPIQDSDVDC